MKTEAEAHRRRQQAAIHEAGHAVAAHVPGLPFTVATIEEDANASGHVLFEAGELDDAMLRRHVIATFSGPLAQQRAGFAVTDGAEGDLEAIGDLI